MRKSAIAVAAAVLAIAADPAAAKTSQDFIKDAIQGDVSEIMLGRLAARAGGSQDVKDFGHALVADHTTAKRQASAVARKMRVTPPTHATAAADAEYAKLQVLSGASFDKEFVRYMVSDHQSDISEFEVEARAGDGATSRLAEKQLPTLRKHLDKAQSLASALQSAEK